MAQMTVIERERERERERDTRGPFAVSLAMIKAFCPTNTILDTIEKALEKFKVNFSAWQ